MTECCLRGKQPAQVPGEGSVSMAHLSLREHGHFSRQPAPSTLPSDQVVQMLATHDSHPRSAHSDPMPSPGDALAASDQEAAAASTAAAHVGASHRGPSDTSQGFSGNVSSSLVHLQAPLPGSKDASMKAATRLAGVHSHSETSEEPVIDANAQLLQLLQQRLSSCLTGRISGCRQSIQSLQILA